MSDFDQSEPMTYHMTAVQHAAAACDWLEEAMMWKRERLSARQRVESSELAAIAKPSPNEGRALEYAQVHASLAVALCSIQPAEIMAIRSSQAQSESVPSQRSSSTLQ